MAEKLSDSATLTLVIKSAYRALYEAKGIGGNVVKRGLEAVAPGTTVSMPDQDELSRVESTER